jgi:lantibiotic biosynthesis protein
MALDLVKELASRMRNPDWIEEQVMANPNRQDLWHPLSLSHGYPGILVLFSTLDKIFPEEGWDQQAHLLVLKIKEALEAGKLGSFSLFGGLAGCCFAIQSASRGKTRYQKLIERLSEQLFNKAGPIYLERLKEKIDLGLPSHSDLYDPISGVSGIALYALHNRDYPPALSFLAGVLKFCIDFTKEIKIGSYKLPGWYVPRHYQFTENDKQNYPKGNFNLGLAHGICGILGLLSIALINGVVLDGQREAIEKITRWLIAKSKKTEGISYWMNRVDFEEELLGIEPKNMDSSMEGWCYGTPGVSRTLYLAGKALGDKNLEKLALESFLGVFQRIDLKTAFITPTFCHGTAGLLTITGLMARDTASIELKKRVSDLENEVLSHYHSNYQFGFKDREVNLFDRSGLNKVVEIDKVGMLDGVTGILLSLISARTQYFGWTQPFLIEGEHND